MDFFQACIEGAALFTSSCKFQMYTLTYTPESKFKWLNQKANAFQDILVPLDLFLSLPNSGSP